MNSAKRRLTALTQKFSERPDHVPLPHYRFFMISNYSYFLSAILHGVLVLLFVLVGVPQLVFFNMGSVAVHVIALYLNLRGFLQTSLILQLIEIPLFAFINAYTLGDVGLNAVILVAIGFVLFSTIKYISVKVILTVVLASVYAVLNLYTHSVPPAIDLAPNIVNSIKFILSYGVVLGGCYLAYHFSAAAARAEAALHQQAAELQARNEELDAFAHTVAHDLKNPLALVMGYAEVLHDHNKMPDEQMLTFIETIRQTGLKMNDIIDDLMLLSGVRTADVTPKPLDMSNLVAGAQERLAKLIEDHQAKITVPEKWPVALGYGPWIEAIWANFISNGIKYGGNPPRVELGATEQADGQVSFWVHDDGPGLTPEEQANLFRPFTRPDYARTLGHGLGLSIAQRIVEKLGGQVGVESEIGQGSTLTFTLPR